MEETLFAFLPLARKKSVVVREGFVSTDGVTNSIPQITLDTGASHASYVGAQVLAKFRVLNGIHASTLPS